MPGGGAGVVLRERTHVAGTRPTNFGGSVQPFYQQRVGVGLHPLQAAAVAVGPDADVVFLAGRNLRGHQHAAGSARQSEQHGPVVVEPAAGHHGVDVGAELRDRKAGHVLQQVKSVGADIAHGTGHAAAGGVGAPSRLFVVGALLKGAEPALRVLHVDFANRPERASRDELPRFFHHRVAGVGVREAEPPPAGLGHLLQLFGLGQREGHWLVEDDVEAIFQRHAGGLKVQVIGCHDGNDLHSFSFGSLLFGFDERLVRVVYPLSWQA